MAATDTLSDLLVKLSSTPRLQINAPTLGRQSGILYTPKPQSAMEALIKANLAKTLEELGVAHGDEVTVTCPTMAEGQYFTLVIHTE
jgi:hypothetical protein